MQTKLIQGATPRANDQHIVAKVEAEAHDEWGGGGNDMVIGVRNEAGQIYRHFITTGMGEFMNAVSALEDLKLRDELVDAVGMREGCDAIFA